MKTKFYITRIKYLSLILLFVFVLIQSIFAQEVPVLQWAKSLGSAGSDTRPRDMFRDASGNIYAIGEFFGTVDLDPGAGVFNLTAVSTSYDIYITKYNTNGDLIWAKAIRGTRSKFGFGIAADALGNVYATGHFDGTVDLDPGTATFNLSANNGPGYADIFILKLDGNGDFVWAKSIGGSGYDEGMGLGLDATGNVYISGSYAYTVDFNPNAGVFNLVSPDFDAIYIAKYDNNGNLLWAKSIDGKYNQEAYNLALDATGNVYTTGRLYGTPADPVDFDPGPGVFNLAPDQNAIFISKLDENGNFVWAKLIEGEYAQDIAFDASSNLFVTGKFIGTTDFDPNAGTNNLTSAAGPGDIFVLKLTNNGDFVWAKQMGGTGFTIFSGNENRGYGITIDSNGNVLTTGRFAGTGDFDPGPGTLTLSANSTNYTNGFISKLDNNGNFIWAIAYGSNFTYDCGYSITTDAVGNIYSFGQYGGTTDFDPSACTFNLSGGNSGYIWKLSLGTPIPAPTISSFTPTIGPIGTSVTITGTNFSAIPAENTVRFFNNRTATVTASTTTTISATVPASAVTGIISVTTNCLTVNSATNFTVGASTLPTIASFTPSSANVGASIIITGTNFSATPANNVVSFNGTAAVVTASTTTSITTTVPTGATSGKITVTVAGNSATSVADFIVTSPQTFNTRWNLALVGSGSNQLTFSTNTSGTVNYAWQEISPGNATGVGSWSGTTLTITGLPTGATIRLLISPTNFQRFIITSSDRNRLTQVEQWGTTTWTSMQRAFLNCANLQVTATDLPNLSGVTNMSEMFSGCAILNSPSNIGSWNTSTVTDMNFMFYGASSFNQNIGSWNTSAVTNMSAMFSEAIIFNQNIGLWNTSEVIDMSEMFQFAGAFNQDIGSWNTGKVMDMSSMFSDANAFNQNIGAWNTSAVTNMRNMFRLATAFNQNLGSWSLNASVDIRNLFDDSGMNCNNYSATLIGWNANPSTPSGRTLGATGRQYGTNAASARANLTTTKAWTITGDTPSGVVCGALAIPLITSFAPTTGSVGTTVIITGTNFSPTPINNVVSFNGINGVVTASTATSITTSVPVAATTGKISVTVAGNTTTSINDFIVTTQSGIVTIAPEPLSTNIGGIVTLNLLSLISTLNDNLDINTIEVTTQPPSGAFAEVVNGVLTVDYTNILFSGKESITISACDTDGNCAFQLFEIEVIGDVFVYNGISPNNDQLNEKFIIQHIDAIPETRNNKVIIYNRWGDVVWEGDNYNNEDVVFVGKNAKGNDLPSGTYFYKIQFSSNKKMKTGYLVIKK